MNIVRPHIADQFTPQELAHMLFIRWLIRIGKLSG